MKDRYSKKKSAHLEQHARTERMVAALAHEIKNPLNSMKGASQYLHDKYNGQNEISEFTGIIIDEINRLERYLNEFLSFSSGMSLKLGKVRLENFITAILMIVKHSFPSDIRATIKKTPMPEVYIDQEQMRQVLVNFFSNSGDALRMVKNPKAEVILDADKKNAYITLRDNGTGINAKDIKHIFEPFFTTKDTGLGIGLAISNTIVKKHGGRITVKSVPHVSTEFTISVPLEKRRNKR